jgi:hypothetical protein
MQDLPFEWLIGRTLKVSALLLAPCVILLALDYATPVAWGLVIGLGTGIWNSYFLQRRIKLVDPADKFYRQRLQQSLLTGLVFRLLTIMAMLFVASRISVVAMLAAAAGIFVVWGVFVAVAAGAFWKETKANTALKYRSK